MHYVYNMKKVQVLFPEPVLKQLKERASADDRPLSELIRRATEFWLERAGATGMQGPRKGFPTFDGGEVMVDADHLREAVYGEGE